MKTMFSREIRKEIKIFNAQSILKWERDLETLSRQKGIFQDQLISETNHVNNLKTSYYNQTKKSKLYQIAQTRRIKAVDDNIELLDKKITQLENEYKQLHQNIENAKLFFEKINSEPHLLCIHLAQYALQQFEAFEKDHPATQSDSVRLALYKMNEKIAAIVPNNISSLSVSECQIRYLQLTGFLQHMFLDTQTPSLSFTNCVLSILKESHLDANGTLPSQQGKSTAGKGCRAQFDKFAKANQFLFKPDFNAVQQSEKQNFLEAYNSLQTSVRKGHAADHEAVKLARVIYAEAKREEKSKTGADLKYYTQILEQTRILMLDPTHDKATQRFTELSEHAPGQGSKKNKIRGAMLCAFAVGLIGLAATVFVLTGNVGVAQNGVTIGIAIFKVGLELCLAGSGLAIGGIGASFFYRGMNHGIAKHMRHFKTAIEKQKLHSEHLKPHSELIATVHP